MGKVNSFWSPRYGSTEPKANKIPKYDIDGKLRSAAVSEVDDDSVVLNKGYFNKVVDGPDEEHEYVSEDGDTIYALDAGEGYSYMFKGNILYSFDHIGNPQEIIQENKLQTFVDKRYIDLNSPYDSFTVTSGNGADVKHIGFNTAIYAEGPSVTSVDYNNKVISGKIIFHNGILNAVDAFVPNTYNANTNDHIYVACGGRYSWDNSGKQLASIEIVKYKPLSSNATSSESHTELSNETENPVDDIKISANKIIAIYKNSKNEEIVEMYSYGDQQNLTRETTYKLSTNEIELVGSEFVNNYNSILIAYIDNGINKVTRLDIIGNTLSLNEYINYNEKIESDRMIGFKTDNDGNSYILYNDRTIVKYDNEYSIIWRYETKLSSNITSFAIDKDASYIVIGAQNGQFETIKFNRLNSPSAEVFSLRNEIKSVEEGSLIRKIEVCQLNGSIELTGDITGTTTLTADNTCLIDPSNSDHIMHKITLDTKLSDEVNKHIVSIENNITNLTNDMTTHKHTVSDITDIVISDTEPSNPSEGMIWFRPL